MRTLSYFLLVSILLVASCNKSGKANDVVPEINTWVVNDTVFYKQAATAFVQYSMNVVGFGTDASFSTAIYFKFTQRPNTSKRYKVVYSPKADDEVAIEEQYVYGHSYSFDTSGFFLDVSETNGNLVYTTESTIPLTQHNIQFMPSYDKCAAKLSE